MKQVCPKCNNYVEGVPHASMQDKLGKMAIKNAAKAIGGAIGTIFAGPVGTIGGSLLAATAVDYMADDIIQTEDYDFACPKCGHQWVSKYDEAMEQLLDENEEIVRCKCCHSVNAQDAKTCTSCGMPIVTGGIYTLRDMVIVLNEKSKCVSEQVQNFLECQLLVVGFIQENTSKSLETSYIKQFFSSAMKALSVCDGMHFEERRLILNKMLQTIVTAKYAKMLYQKKKERIPSDINESLQLLKETIAFVFRVIEQETSEKINWVDKELKSVYNVMQEKNELLFGANPLRRSDEYNPSSQKAIVIMEEFLLSLKQPMKECGLSLEKYKERYFSLIYETQKRDLPMSPKLKALNMTEVGMVCFSALASPILIYCALWMLHIFAYMFHYITFTLLDIQEVTGSWIDSYSDYWFILSLLLAGLGGARLFVKWDKIKKENEAMTQSYNQEVMEVNKHNEELKTRILEETEGFLD